MDQLETPVILLMHSRPALLARVLDRVGKVAAKTLLVVADGPNSEAQRAKCEESRALIEDIDWPCDVLKCYSEVNLGCRKRVSTGLDWAFSHVDEAIILEEDCLPDISFFRFCSELLQYYRNDTRIGHISGANFNEGTRRSPYSYYFSRYGTIWGWATWRRAWAKHDLDMQIWPDIKKGGWHYDMFATREEAVDFELRWDKVFRGEVDTWDAQWFFCRMLHGMLSVIPNVNLVSNIGFGPAASRTFDSDNPLAAVPLRRIDFPLSHPPFMVCDTQTDVEFARMAYLERSGKRPRLMTRLANRHFYGAVLRRTPFLGKWWADIRGKRKPRQAGARH